MTGYKGITTLSTNLPYYGGFCKWYYIPREYILAWPAIDATTQYLAAEPILKAQRSWFGPVQVPNDQLGFEEPMTRSGAGIYYKQKVSGFYPGDNGPSRINLENMPYHEYVVVGKQRAGGLFLVLGNDQEGMSFDADYKGGTGGKQTAGANFSFTLDSLNKGFILPSFQGINTIPPVDGGAGGSSGPSAAGVNAKEIIEFNGESVLPIGWTDARKNTFGAFPEIQVWMKRDDNTGYDIARVPISVDKKPPDTTVFTVYLTGPAYGFVVIM